MNDLLHAQWRVARMNMREAKQFACLHHYSKNVPSTTVAAYGLWIDGALKGVAIWGYGVRPKHTIEKWFCGVSVKQYLELNRLCLLDEMPRNSESKFLSRVCSLIRQEFPEVQVLLSWADGLRGKPGYIYQACSWLYGGFITSDFYTNRQMQVIHPRLLITRYGTRGKEIQKQLNLSNWRGRQFMYCRFLCSKSAKKRLLAQSKYEWTQNYPKQGDCVFDVSHCGEPRTKMESLPAFNGRASSLDYTTGQQELFTTDLAA